MTDKYCNISAKETAHELGTNIQNGLSDKEAAKRLAANGRNEIATQKKTSPIKKFFLQFNDFMIITLLAAAAVSYITSLISGSPDITEPAIILAIVVLNAILGIVQENRAQKSLDSLKKISAPNARVIRSGKTKIIPASDVVSGDIILVSAGDVVCADCRICECTNLITDEAPLTGESEPVEKNADIITTSKIPAGDRKNILMSSSSVLSGHGKAIVIGTGMNTEVGQIACMLSESDRNETPLQKKLSETGRFLGIATLIICAIIFITGLFMHLPPLDIFMTSVSLAVAAIPEGLPAIVSIMLAIGLIRMSKRNAIVRNLPSVETLGAASVICSDKTGTLTLNKMHVVSVFSNDESLTLSLAALCTSTDSASQNPTDIAVIEKAADTGKSKAELETEYRQLCEIPFSPQTKYMAVLCKSPKGSRTVVKGAPEYILPMCSEYHKSSQPCPLTNALKSHISAENKRMTDNALRAIAVAYRDSSSVPGKISCEKLVFAGLIAIEDPPRPEAAKAVSICKKAGIRPVMITGDHAGTALSVAKRTGIADNTSKVMTGDMLDKISDASLAEHIDEYSVFARVTPAHKVKIVKAFQKNGRVTAMTGDGVNDAPALSRADIGCSMGKSGTEVAKAASDMILTDDNFATIVSAVREGRNIFANIRKSVLFLLSSNIGEILTVFAGVIFGWAAPLTAAQLLWVNLVTDSLPAIALGLEPPAPEIMSKPPRDPKKSLFSDGLWLSVIWEGLLIGSLALTAFSVGTNLFGSLKCGRTMSFAVLSLSELVHAFNMRSDKSVIKSGLFKNRYLTAAFLLGLILEITVIMLPPAAAALDAVPLNVSQWGVVALLSIIPLVIIEIQKHFNNFFHKQKDV